MLHCISFRCIGSVDCALGRSGTPTSCVRSLLRSESRTTTCRVVVLAVIELGMGHPFL